MSARAFPWNRLGIDPTSDKAAIRKAYADVLRGINPDEDIAGFAELRRARDHALWLAAQAERAPAGGEDEGELYGLGTLDDDDDAALWDDDDVDSDERWDVNAPAQAAGSDTSPDTSPGPAPELNEAQQRAQAAWNRMLDVLYPDGEPSEDAVTHAELDDGLAALGVLIARAEEADIEEHDALDGALAELFARTWPRSAPFVEPANTAFLWLGESGSLEERPALRFLNDRLKGMRFHEKVQKPDHPLHKAWTELCRPGRAGVFDRMRIKRLDVHKLLLGIRERYPELEAHLDPERVSSWEGGGAGSAEGYSNARSGFSGTLIAVVLFFALLRGLATLIGPNDTRADPDGPPPVEQAAAAFKTAQYDIAAIEAFGRDTRMADVREADASFAADLRKLVDTVGVVPGAVLGQVRGKALQSGNVADLEGLVARGELRQIWLGAARESPEQCRLILRGDFQTDPLALSGEDRKREQVLLKRLLDAKFLSGGGKLEGGSFTVPGWVVEQTIAKSGLAPDVVTAAFRDPAHPARCELEYAILGVMLKAPGKVPVELLRAI